MNNIVLMYHRIENSNKKHVSDLSYIYKIKETLISSNNLDSDIKNLHKNKWKHLPVEKFLKTRNKKVFHITFDDGYKEQLNIAVPILLKNKIRSATFFISTCTLYKDIIPLPFD